ncbi:TlpA family protein disulfide reductase [Haliangium sp.]|uniref:TlpA family protein disulfide reductase n=1 Tax=Haliangium sp. TaxID=2663208 RepID=UPI003D0F8BF4
MSDESPVQTAPSEAPRPAQTATKLRWLLAIVVAAVAVAIIAYKEFGPRSPAAANPAPSPGAFAERARASTGSVLLFADPREADDSCGCGQIIRLVRGARAHGVAVREVAPGSDTALEHEYRVTVVPTVLFLDSKGQVIARHEGEAGATIEAIRTRLDELTKARR